MNMQDKWDSMVCNSIAAKKDFNGNYTDDAIIWADNELKMYKRALLLLKSVNNDFGMTLNDEDTDFVNMIIRQAESS